VLERPGVLILAVVAALGVDGGGVAVTSEPWPSIMTEQDTLCSGSSLDLRELLAQRACEVSEVPAAEDLSGRIRATIMVSPDRVLGGEAVTVRMSFRNVSNEPVDLYFTAHVGPMTAVMVTDEATGAPVFPPPDMPSTSSRPGPPYPVRGTVLPGGEIYREIRWEASEVEWLTDALPRPHSMPPMRKTGPLPEGTYSVRMQSMFHFAGYGLEQPVARLQVLGGAELSPEPS